MILSFKPQFEPLIMSGKKIHSIREDKHNRWKAGRLIHCATGVRTKNYNCFLQQYCISTQKIELQMDGKKKWLRVRIYNRDLPDRTGKSYKESLFYPPFNKDRFLTMLAKNDGLTVHQFFDWFLPNQKRYVFIGKIIHWTDKTYGF